VGPFKAGGPTWWILINRLSTMDVYSLSMLSCVASLILCGTVALKPAFIEICFPVTLGRPQPDCRVAGYLLGFWAPSTQVLY
jgi:hypothetical protein